MKIGVAGADVAVIVVAVGMLVGNYLCRCHPHYCKGKHSGNYHTTEG